MILNINYLCYYCNKEFDKTLDLRKHILLECFYNEIINKN